MHFIATPFEPFFVFFYNYPSYLTFSNLSLFLILVILFMHSIFFVTKYGKCLFAFNQFKYWTKEIYKLSYYIIDEQLPKEGKRYISFLQYLFFTICLFNLLGFYPYSVALTSQACLIFIISLAAFIGMQYIAVELYNSAAMRFFLPSGIPSILSIFIINVELISYVFRVISLSVRILANIIAGHLLCIIIGIFVLAIYSQNDSILFLASIVPGIVIIALCFLELFVCFLQAYVFVILCCMYLRDVLTIYLH